MNRYERFCFSLVGRRMKAKREKYIDLRNDLKSARMKASFEVYASTALMTSLISGIIAALLLGMVTYIFRLPDMIVYHGQVPESLFFLSDYSLLIGTLIAAVVAFTVIAGIVYLVFMFYPAMVAGNRKRNIDATLPYAINYITAMSSAGIPPAEIFRQLANSTMYGESAAEARYVTREIDMFGKDLIEALRITAMSTPSERMKEFFQGAIGSVGSGSNLTVYFRTKSEQYALENRQEQKLFLETLSLIAESYVTAMVAGPLFLIILQSIMSVLGGESQPLFLYIIIYLMIPFGSVLFVILISSMTPEG